MLTLAERKVTKKGHRLRSAQQKLYHNCLHLILKELLDLQSDDKNNATDMAVNVTGMGKCSYTSNCASLLETLLVMMLCAVIIGLIQ
eukprot:14567411-Ditylum_brightwellii.AAC.1